MLFDDNSVSCFLFVHLLLKLVKEDSTILDGNCAVYELLLMSTQRSISYRQSTLTKIGDTNQFILVTPCPEHLTSRKIQAQYCIVDDQDPSPTVDMMS
jgi:hypothetical protein